MLNGSIPYMFKFDDVNPNYDKDNNISIVLPWRASDESWIGVEPFTGIPVQTGISLTYSSQVFNDTLIQIQNSTEYGSFVPHVTINKVMTLTTSQAETIFKPVRKMTVIKWVVTFLLVALGALCWWLNCIYRGKRQSMHYQMIVQAQMFEQIN